MDANAGLPPRSAVPWRSLIPAALISVGVAVAGVRGFTDPFAWLIIGPGLAWIFAIMLTSIPVAAFWLVPISLCWPTYLPVRHYELLVIALAAVMLLGTPRGGGRARLSLQPVELRYLVFLAVLLTGIPAALSVWRFGGAFKVYVVGIAAFEVARHASRRYGREAMLWGPLVLVLITVAMLGTRMLESGVPGFKSIALRSYLSRLSWGSSNYVAAVMVLCLPALTLLVRECPARSRRRWFALGAVLASLATMFLTLSRGGFVLSAIYLLTLTGVARRSGWKLGLAVAAALGILIATPLGGAALARFTNAQSLDSILARVHIWTAAWERGVTHLPFGVGAGQGWIQTDKLQWIDPHDFPLTLFSESGPLGLAAWLWIMVAVWGASTRLLHDAGSRAAGGAMRATLVLALLNSLFEPTLVGNLYHLLFWWLLGIYHGAGAPADLPAAASAVPA